MCYNDGWRVSKHPRMMSDVNGDGKSDIIAFGSNSVYVSLSTGSSFASKTTWSTDLGYNDNWRVDEHVRTVSDVNGDGKADIIAFGDNSVYVSLPTGSSFASKTTWSTDFGSNDNWGVNDHIRTVSDVNGDGKSDIIAFGDNSVYVSLSTGSSFASKTTWSTDFGYNDNWDVEDHVRRVSDVNADGRADIIAFGDNSVYVSLSTGAGFASKTAWTSEFTYNDNWDTGDHVRRVSDVNNDGKGDIVGFGEDSVYVMTSSY